MVTIGISIVRQYTEKIKPPRTIFVRWPFGHPLGEPGHRDQQAAVLGRLLTALHEIDRPGTIIDVEWPWRRQTYPPAPWLNGQGGCPGLSSVKH